MAATRVSRRHMLKLLSLAAGGAALGACTANSPAVSHANGAAPGGAALRLTTTPEHAVRLSYWGHGYAGREQVVAAVVDDYLSEVPGADIKLDSIPYGDFETKLATAFAAGTQPDIVSAGDWIIPAYVEKQLLVPLDPGAWGKASDAEVLALFDPGTVDGLLHQGKLYGYPLEVSVHTPGFKVDHFVEAGLDPDAPPDTWEDWVQRGLSVVRYDTAGRMQRQWFEWYFTNPAYWFQIFGPLLLGLGGSFLNADATAGTLDTAQGHQALQFFVDTIHTWKLTDPAFEAPDPRGNFVAGRETYAWHNLPGSRYMSNEFEDMQYGQHWKLQPMLKWSEGVRRNVFYSFGFLVTAQSPTPGDAWSFVEYMTRFPERTIQWADVAGLIQTRTGWNELDVIKHMPFTEVFVNELKHSVTMPRTPKYNEVAVELQKQMGRLVATPPDPVNVVAADFDAAVTAMLGG